MGLKEKGISKLFNARTNIETIKKAVKEFRADFVDSTTPAMLVLDIDSDILARLDLDARSKEKVKKAILNKIDSYSFSITSSKLEAVFNKALEKLNSDLSRLADRKQRNPENPPEHIEYRNAFKAFGASINSELYIRAVLKIEDPESMIKNGQGKVVLIGKSFNSLKDTCANKAINEVFKEENIRSIKDPSKFLTAGEIVVVGHTRGEVVSNGTSVYRINTPVLYDRMLRLEAAGKGMESLQTLEQEFAKNVPIFTKNTVTFNQNFSSTATNLFNIGLSVTVYMDPSENSASGAKEEKEAITLAVKKVIEEKQLPDIASAIKSRFSYIKNSPNLSEYIEELIASTITGKKPKEYKYVDKRTSTAKALVPIIANKVNGKVKASPVRLSGRKNTSILTSGIANLEKLLNIWIRDEVQRNMGTGNDRKVLNYRTGRFADSVKIERLSQSRAGMITVFYSYMKNPYATFSDGGRQQYPKSRDPKLLISKSIREIASREAYSNLRAVNV